MGHFVEFYWVRLDLHAMRFSRKFYMKEMTTNSGGFTYWRTGYVLESYIGLSSSIKQSLIIQDNYYPSISASMPVHSPQCSKISIPV